MIRLVTSNLVEALADTLAEDLAAGRRSLFDAVDLIVPNTLVEGFVKQRLATRLGIAAHVRAHRLQGFLREIARGSAPEIRFVDRAAMEGELLALFHDPRRAALVELAPVRAYLGAADGDAAGLDRRRVQLATKLASLFEEYAFSRPEMLAAWRAGALAKDVDPPTQRWQRELWLALAGVGGPLAPPAAVTLPDFFAAVSVEALRAPPAVHVFGISYVARLYRMIFASLGRKADVHIYALNPCREYWEDLEPARRTRREARRFPRRRATTQLSLLPDGGDEAIEAAASSEEPENELLARWGRPGRDNVKLLNQLTGCDFDSRFVDPVAGDAPTLLATLQQEVLDRRPGGDRPEADASLVLLRAADPRRELESVAAEIFALVRDDAAREARGEPGRPLRFSDVAVIVPPAAAPSYLPLARAVFHEASELPHTIVDLPNPGEQRLREAVLMLVALPGSALARPDLLRLAMHPTVARRFPDVDPEDWVTLCDELQIVNGVDRADHAGSYLDRDQLSWDQGLRRLALGAFLSGAPSGEDRPFTVGGEPYLPAETTPGGEPAARALGIVARELVEFARAARGAAAPIADWLALVRRTIAATIRPATPDEESALGDCFAALERLSAEMPAGLRTSYLVAAELLSARLREDGGRGRQRPPEGVTVASFVPMRALPFRVVFVVGLEERTFPSGERPDTLDLRWAAPRDGDVSPRQRDEYMLLETLLSAREKLYLSHVERDPTTGEDRDPSAAVLAIREVLGAELAAAITRPRPPLARYADPAACAVIPAAAAERRAAALGGALRRAAEVVALPPVAELRGALAPEVWRSIAPALALLPPPEAPAAAGPARRAPALADLRRFLECPLQASVRVLLPMRGEDDAGEEAEAALREHEALDEAGPATTLLLREVFAAAFTPTGPGLEAAYDALAEARRLDGTLPGGLFGRAARDNHLDILRRWHEGLSRELAGELPARLAPIWLGGAPEHRRDADVRPALRLDVDLPGGRTTIDVGGATEPLAEIDGRLVAVTLIRSPYVDYVQRDLLRPWVTHLALAATGISEGPLRALVIRPDDKDGARVDPCTFPALPAAEARRRLSALATELLAGVHPYLLPCEGLFTWRRRQLKGEAMTVREAVLMVRDDGRTRLSSKYGPVPDAVSYPVPADGAAEAIVERRFQAFFEVLP